MYSGLFAWLFCFVYSSAHNVDVDLNGAVDNAFGVGLVEQVYKDLPLLDGDAGIGGYGVAVDELAVKRDDIKLGSVRELPSVEVM